MLSSKTVCCTVSGSYIAEFVEVLYILLQSQDQTELNDSVVVRYFTLHGKIVSA